MNQPKGSRKKFTLIATEEGLEKAKKALIRLGFESKTNFAEAILMSRSTVSKFFNCKPIQLDSFKKICEELGGLRSEEIAGISKTKQEEIIKVKDPERSSKKEIGSDLNTQTLVTTIDPQAKPKKLVITLEGDFESFTNINIKFVQSNIQKHSGNTVEIKDIQPGSIKISLEGSPEDIDKLITAINSGKLTQLDAFPIKNIVEVDEETETTEINDKWELVQKIRAKKVKKLDFRKIDLSDADLSDADLVGADLVGADLSGTDLSGADLSGADLVGVNLSDANLSDANLVGAYLSRANFENAYLSGANFENTNLSGANLVGANLVGANLSRADLIGVNLFGAYLSGANFENTNLSGADLSGADLSGADLSGVKLFGANVKNAYFGDNLGISTSLKRDLIARGAIFKDSPGERSNVLTPF